MKPGTKDILRTCGIALALMIAPPAAFRVWMAYHPQPVRDQPALPGADHESIRLNTAKLLLQKPLGKWTDSDRKIEPCLHAWLAAHAKTVLPWEWSAAARDKDPDGYRDAWETLLHAERKTLGRSLEDAGMRIASARKSGGIALRLHVHATNELARLTAILATNAYPSAVTRQVLSKGRFWGWNTDEELVQLKDAAAAAALLESISADADRQIGTARSMDASVKSLETHETYFRRLVSDIEDIVCAIEQDGKKEKATLDIQDRALPVLVASIRACFTWRESCPDVRAQR